MHDAKLLPTYTVLRKVQIAFSCPFQTGLFILVPLLFLMAVHIKSQVESADGELSQRIIEHLIGKEELYPEFSDEPLGVIIGNTSAAIVCGGMTVASHFMMTKVPMR